MPDPDIMCGSAVGSRGCSGVKCPVEKVVEKEVIKEVPVEKVVEKTDVKEVPVEKVAKKEVIKEVPVEKPMEKEYHMHHH